MGSLLEIYKLPEQGRDFDEFGDWPRSVLGRVMGCDCWRVGAWGGPGRVWSDIGELEVVIISEIDDEHWEKVSKQTGELGGVVLKDKRIMATKEVIMAVLPGEEPEGVDAWLPG